eukprot:gene15279-6737_t
MHPPPVLSLYSQPIPAVLEIPSKSEEYKPENDTILRQVLIKLGLGDS